MRAIFMGSRVRAAALAVAVYAVAALQGQVPSYAALPEVGVEFQDGAGATKGSFAIGEVAAFYVRDAALGTVATSTATWTAISATVPAETWWSLATGDPRPASFALSPESAYDGNSPASTPLRPVPDAAVNGVTTLLTDYMPSTGEFKLANNVNAGSTLLVSFAFDVTDTYEAGLHRADVRSTSDGGGEGVAISEVVGETDASPNPTGGIFRGEVLLSGDVAALAIGDGAVWVRPGDLVTGAYYEADGATVIDTHQVQMSGATPVPGVGVLSLVFVSAVFALAIGWRRLSPHSPQ